MKMKHMEWIEMKEYKKSLSQIQMKCHISKQQLQVFFSQIILKMRTTSNLSKDAVDVESDASCEELDDFEGSSSDDDDIFVDKYHVKQDLTKKKKMVNKSKRLVERLHISIVDPSTSRWYSESLRLKNFLLIVKAKK